MPSPTIPPAGGRSHDATSPTTANSIDPENPHDQVGAPIVLTGTVRRHGCVILEVAGRRWALLGGPAATLTDGQHVTVRGRPAAVPAGCDASFGLTVRSAT